MLFDFGGEKQIVFRMVDSYQSDLHVYNIG